jgi:hypothetical protein
MVSLIANDQLTSESCVEVTFYHLPVDGEHTSLAGYIYSYDLKFIYN